MNKQKSVCKTSRKSEQVLAKQSAKHAHYFGWIKMGKFQTTAHLSSPFQANPYGQKKIIRRDDVEVSFCGSSRFRSSSGTRESAIASIGIMQSLPTRTRDPSSYNAYASLSDPMHTSQNANASTTQDILWCLCKPKLATRKSSARRVAQAAKFPFLSLFFFSPTAAAAAAARGPSAIFAQGLVTTSRSHVVVTFGSGKGLPKTNEETNA